MPRSTDPAGATAGQSKPQGPPRSRGQFYHRVAALNNRRAPRAAGKWGRASANSPMSELAHLMEEPPGGPNQGRRASTNPEVEGSHVPLGADDWQAAEFLREGGWTFVHPHDGARAGIRSHVVNQHTVLHPDEHVDVEALRPAFEARLGFTFDELRSVYSTGGRIPAALGELRGRIDARLLALSRSGANMDLFGRVTGLNPSTLDRALARARDKETP